jgi:glycosyltransferase involved in cell wall biosynthesis
MHSNGARPASRNGAAHQQQGGAPGSQPRTAWRVIHACEYARDVLPVVEGQIAAGMRPYIVTPQGAGSAELYLARPGQEQARSFSLLRSWQDVRNWRKSILECEPESSADLVHAHAFAAGMAAVRSCGCVVYDLTGCIEELATAAELCEPGSWMGRSFRVAEQFILSRASAVVVHSSGMKDAAIERGADKDSVFVIPQPLTAPAGDDVSDFTSRQPMAGQESRLGSGTGPRTRFFVPQFGTRDAVKLPSSAGALLEAFAISLREHPDLCLMLEAPERFRGSLNELATRLGIQNNLELVEPDDAEKKWMECDAIIATATLPEDVVQARQANEICLKAMVAGKTLLAADIPRHRDVSPDGRGCLWFDADDPRDLGHRISFLALNPEFRAALSASGQAFITESRSLATIGARYDQVYRHALSRKRTIANSPGMASFQMSPSFT